MRGRNLYKHGLAGHFIHRAWKHLKSRCYNTNDARYKNYGGRGITICDEWKNDFKAFYDYMIALPNVLKKGFSIDRINNDKGYEVGNMRWSDAHIQAANRGVKSNNKSGYSGVYKKMNRFGCGIRVRGKQVFLGYFNNPEDAVDARNKYIVDNDLTEYKVQ